MKSQYEYNDVLASNVTTSYKKSCSNYHKTTINCGMARK